MRGNMGVTLLVTLVTLLVTYIGNVRVTYWQHVTVDLYTYTIYYPYVTPTLPLHGIYMKPT